MHTLTDFRLLSIVGCVCLNCLFYTDFCWCKRDPRMKKISHIWINKGFDLHIMHWNCVPTESPNFFHFKISLGG